MRFGKAAAPAIFLFPNPATATTVDLAQLPTGTYQVRVLDAVGCQVALTSGAGGATVALDLRALASGTYIAQVCGTDGQQSTKRLVRE